MCVNLEIKCYFLSPSHPQVNKQVKVVNKWIKHHMKTQLSSHKKVWVDELPSMLCVYKITPYSFISETPYLLTFEAEVIIPVKIGLPNY